MLPSDDGKGFGGRHAVVVGGSMAGLLAARVLADHFERVTLIERDRLPDGPEGRKGVPAAGHFQICLTGAADLLGRLFPGFWQELEAAGSVRADPGRDVVLYRSVPWLRTASPLCVYLQSRSFLDWHVRRRLGGHVGVPCLGEADVTGRLHD